MTSGRLVDPQAAAGDPVPVAKQRHPPGIPDLIVSGGQVIDGTGAPRRRADVAVGGRQIVAVGDLDGVPARHRVAAAGRVVTPGFIDLLGHSYYSLFVDPTAASKVFQGVTLEVTGERLGAGPLYGAAWDLANIEGLGPLGLDLRWEDHKSYAALLTGQGAALNIACTVPAALLRASVSDPWQETPLSRSQFDRLCRLLMRAFEHGAVSLTFVLEEPPCCFFRPPELEQLLSIARDHDRLVMFHLRDEGANVLAALDEVLGLLRKTGARGEVLHLKVLGAEHWHLLASAVQRLDQARRDGVDVQANMYPYTAAALALQQLVPGLVQRHPARVATELRSDPAFRQAVLRELTDGRSTPDWNGIRRAVVPPGQTALPFSELARRRGTTPAEFALDLLSDAQDWIHLNVETISDEALDLLNRMTWMGVVSDGSARNPDIATLVGGPVHPRDYGTFPRFLREFVHARGLMDEATAIQRLTARAADRLGLADRGRVVPGAVADLLVFDPDLFIDRATPEQPNQLATGLDWVLVNGEVVIQEGVLTGALPGVVVRAPTTT